MYSICNESTDLSVADCAGVYVVQFGESASELIHPIADVRPGRTQAAPQQPSYGVFGGVQKSKSRLDGICHLWINESISEWG